MIIKAAKRIFNSDKICRSYSDLNFGATFLEHSVYLFFATSRHQPPKRMVLSHLLATVIANE